MSKWKRKCGECQECCVVLPILELEKPQETPCKHLGCNGCEIYTDKSKPKVCSNFACAWLEGILSENDRPDKLGLMFWVAHTGMYLVSETRPGAFDASKNRLEALKQRISDRVFKEFGRRPKFVLMAHGQQGTGLLDDGFRDRYFTKNNNEWCEKVPYIAV